MEAMVHEAVVERPEEETNPGRARVVEIPMRWGPGCEEVEAAALAKRCRYEGMGRRCEAEAVRDGLCARHEYWEKLQPYGMAMVCPDNRAGVQEVLRRTLSLVLASLLTPQQALVIVAICRAMLKTM